MTTIEFISIALALVALIFAIKVWLQYDHDIQRMYDTLNNKITRYHEYDSEQFKQSDHKRCWFAVVQFKQIAEMGENHNDRLRSLEREIDREDDV